ncbi:hypothetical protein [Luteimonas cellulosilyticus]|nr:hypothetical protein [Luteimonas cellulosilyticus]
MFLLVLGWSSFVGSIGDGAIGLYALWVVAASGWDDPGLQVGALLQAHLPALLWVKAVAAHVLPAHVVAWLFALPALLYFPARIVMSGLLGWWALATARTLGARSPPSQRPAPQPHSGASGG